MTGSDYSALCKQSPDKAYKTLFDEYCNYVYAVVTSKLRSCAAREDIEECVSDIFAEIYKKYDVDNAYEGDMRGYISVIAKRRAINAFHTLTGREDTVSLDDDGVPEARDDHDPEENEKQADMSRLLMEKIKSLGEPDSTIVIMRFYYNRSSNEIAQQLDLKASNVRMRCSRAIERLKKLLADTEIQL